MRTHFSERCPVFERVHSVPCEASLLCSGHVMHTTISKGEMAPDKLITSHVFFRKNSLGRLCPPQLGLTKGHLVSMRDLFETILNHREEQGQCSSQTKSLITYFTVGLRFCLDLLCVLLGVPQILWDGPKSQSWKITGPTWQHSRPSYRPSYSCKPSIFS